ncbi:Alpha/beta hydrolase family [Novymonas esmeraldas]|uniref:Alpha/beta hydrolase family n=1 Tax=Novymonas esmeraldas TaxID=1808958 RepID=A0AAW0EK17_9TRYP
MPTAVALHAVQTPAKVSLSSAAATAAPVCFVVLHGFLAHSGAMNTFVGMLRNALDAHNRVAMEAKDQTSRVLPFHITTLDARNHGLSPHTPTHTLDDLVTDLSHYLQHDLPATTSHVAALGPGRFTGPHHPRCPRVVGIGHSMGSMTWTRYLMDRQVPSSSSSAVDKGGAAAAEVVGLVSLDMPPVVRSHMSPELTSELIDIIERMKAVNMDAIHDLRSGQEEFLRSGMQDIRVRGLCTTNLALRPVHARDPAQRVAAWKCNLPVLEHSMRSKQLFFSDSYYKEERCAALAAAAAATGNRDGATSRHERTRQWSQGQYALQHPTVGTVPVLSVLGADSPIGGQEQYKQLWERYAADLRQHTLPQATHTVYFDKPRETIECIMDFLKEIHML